MSSLDLPTLRKFGLPWTIAALALGLIPLIRDLSMVKPFDSPKYLLFKLIIIAASGLFIIFQPNFLKSISLTWVDLAIISQTVYLSGCMFFIEHYPKSISSFEPVISILVFYLICRSQSLLASDQIQDTSQNTSFFPMSFTVFLFLVFGSCVVQSIIGLDQFLKTGFFDDSRVFVKSPVVAFFAGPNQFASFLVACCPFVLLLQHHVQGRVKLILMLGNGVILGALITTLSRGAWLGFIASLVVLFYSLVKRLFRFSLARALVIMLALGFSGSLWLFNLNRESAMGRLFIWRVSALMIHDFPWTGIGYGNYSKEYLNYQAKFFDDPSNLIYARKAANIKDAHNEFIEVMTETGLIGLILFFVIILSFYNLSFRLLQKEGFHQGQFIVKACMASVTGIFVHSLFDSPFHILPTKIVLYFDLAFVASLSQRFGHTAFTIRAPNLPFNNLSTTLMRRIYVASRIMATAVVLALGVYFFHDFLEERQAYRNWKKGQDAADMGFWRNAIEYYQRALVRLSNEHELRFHLGSAYLANGEYNEALSTLHLAKREFNDKNLHLCLGMVYEALDDLAGAEQSYATVLYMYPDLLLPRFLLAKIFLQTNRPEKAKQYLEKIQHMQTVDDTGQAMLIKKDAAELLRAFDSGNVRILHKE